MVADQNDKLVSIIIPMYNSEQFIVETISSVRSQTYTEWEAICVDDYSQDSTVCIVQQLCKADSRIKLYCMKENQGAATARNIALQRASGRYIAYLDSDDVWYPEKLELQISFMKSRGIGFSCTSYEIIDEIGKAVNKEIYMPAKLDYWGYLSNNLIQTLTVIADINYIDKELLINPQELRRRNDIATWLKVLKQGNECICLNMVLAKYRRRRGSLSDNRVEAVKGMWNIYKNIACLPMYLAVYCFIRYAFLAIWKRIYKM